MSANTAAHRAVNAVFRIERPALIGGLTRFVRDVGLAEELAQDALVAALEQWPAQGVPDKPGAWLMSTAKRRAIDRFRRDRLLARKHEELARQLAVARDADAPDPDGAIDDDVGDDTLGLLFIACHPVLAAEARVALTLRLLGGLATDEIAHAFLTSEATIAQRIVRAKRTLSEANVPFELPRGEERARRVASVLEVIYLIFNEGYAATAGDAWMRPALCEDALRLGRVLAERVPEQPEAHGLVALMELHASRAAARVSPAGAVVPLLEQNRARWDRILIRRGLAALERAARLGDPPGPYVLQAEITACHARAASAADTDWARVAALYGQLAALSPSPVVELNRAVAVGMSEGPAAGLRLVDALAAGGALARYHLLPAARGDLLAKLGRDAEARGEFERAAGLTRNAREREHLLARAAALPRGARPRGGDTP